MSANTAANAAGGYGRGTGGDDFIDYKETAQKPRTINQLQRDVRKGKAPKTIVRLDKPKQGQEHVHFKDRTSLNRDGSIHDAHKGIHKITKEERLYLQKNGWLNID